MFILNITEPGDRNHALQQIVTSTLKQYSADLCTIFTFNPITDSLEGEPVTAGDLSEAGKRMISQPRPGNLTRWIVEQGTLFVDDLAQSPNFESDFTQQENILSFAALTLLTMRHQKTLAVLYIGFRTPHHFTPAHKRALKKFSEQASSVLQSTWLLGRYRSVARIGQEINQGLDTVDILFRKLYEQVGEILDLSYFMLAVHKPHNNSFDFYIMDKGKMHIQTDMAMGGACAWVMQNKKSLLIDDLDAERETLPTTLIDISGLDPGDPDPSSLIFVPLIFRENCLGVLSVQHVDAWAFDAEDEYILGLLGNQIALALHNMRLFEGLSSLNDTAQQLTQRLQSEDVLEEVVRWIREQTRADIVVLFPYLQADGLFKLPPFSNGDLLDPNYQRPGDNRPDDLARIILQQEAPVFEPNSRALYENLRGDPHRRSGSFEIREQISSTAALALRVADEIVGVLFVNFRQPQRFDATQQHLIQGLANYAAIAIKNAHEFGALRTRHVRELELLRAIDHEISKTLDLQSIMQSILDHAARHLSADAASIMLENPRTLELETKAAFGYNREVSEKQNISLQNEKGITLWVYKNKVPARVADVRSEPWCDIYIKTAPGIISEMDVPLMDGDEVIGIINFESLLPGAYSEADENFLVALAARAVLAIKNALSYEQKQRDAQEMQALQAVGQEIITQLRVRDVLKTILNKALQITPSTTGQIALCDEQRGDLELYTAERGSLEDREWSRLPLGVGVIGWVVEHEQALNITINDLRWQEIYNQIIPNMARELCIPLLENKKVRGVINIESPEATPFSQQDEYLLKKLADLAVIALQNAERYEAAEEGRKRLQALHHIDKEIITQLDNPDRAIQSVLENALKLTQAEMGDLHLYGEGKFQTTYFASKDEQARRVVSSKQDSSDVVERGIVAHVAKTRQSYRTKGDAQEDNHYAGNSSTHSEVAVPFVSTSGEFFGVLNIESQKHYAFDEDDVSILELFAGQAMIAIQVAHSYQQAEEEARRFKLLTEAGERLGAIMEMKQIKQAYDVIVDIFGKHKEGQVVIRRYDEDAQEFVSVKVGGLRGQIPPKRLKLTEGIVGQVFRDRRTIKIPDIRKPPEGVVKPNLKNATGRMLVVTPLQFREKYYGSFSLSHVKPNYFEDADVKLVEGLAQQLAITIYRIETIQAQKRAEQRAEIMNSVGEMANSFAHRVGNFLGALPTQIEFIEEELESPKSASTSRMIEQRLKTILDHVRKALAFSQKIIKYSAQLGEGLKHEPERVVLKHLLAEARINFPTIPDNIHLQLPEDLPESLEILVVSREIDDIISNLVSNAIDAMPGGGKLSIEAYETSEMVELHVSDTGVGIAADQQTDIFKPFWTTKSQGTGFGLYGAYNFAIANRGNLTVDSVPGQGTKFILTLPKARQQR